jgi:alpha-glucosidase
MNKLMKNLLVFFLVAYGLSLSAFEQSENKSSAQPNVSKFSMRMPQLNRERTIRIYLPPKYHQSNKHYPVIYMHDAQNLFDDATSYVGEWGVDEILNKLYSETNFGVIVVGIDHGDKFRINELKPFDDPKYGKGEGELYLEFIVHTLMPYIEQHYRVSKNKDDTAMIGSSLGGLITLYAAHRYPKKFGKIGVFSPAYWIAKNLKDTVAKSPLSADLMFFTIMGVKEGDKMLEFFTDFNDVFRTQVKKFYSEITPNAEHNETYWRSQFERSVRWLFNVK